MDLHILRYTELDSIIFLTVRLSVSDTNFVAVLAERNSHMQNEILKENVSETMPNNATNIDYNTISKLSRKK